jgi:hypothetical protein
VHFKTLLYELILNEISKSAVRKRSSYISIETTSKFEILSTNNINIDPGSENLGNFEKIQFSYKYIVKMTFWHGAVFGNKVLQLYIPHNHSSEMICIVFSAKFFKPVLRNKIDPMPLRST